MTTHTIEEVFSDRTCYHYSKEPVAEALLHEIYDLMKLGPTSANCCPLRMVFVQSTSEKKRLEQCVMKGNIEHVEDAPVTALFAYDTKFYNKLDRLFAHNPGIKKLLEENPVWAAETATRNSALQAAYFMIIARAKGLALGPMSGLDQGKVNKTFFDGTDYKVNFICTLGYRSAAEEHPRLPRLDFEEVCKIV